MSATTRFGKVYEKLASDYPSITFSGYKNSPSDPDQMVVSTSEGEMVVRAVDDDGNYQMIQFDVEKRVSANDTPEQKIEGSVDVGTLPFVVKCIGYIGLAICVIAGFYLAFTTLNNRSGIAGILWVFIGAIAGSAFSLPFLCIASIVESLRSIDAKISKLIK